jgi:hypothetical protein
VTGRAQPELLVVDDPVLYFGGCCTIRSFVLRNRNRMSRGRGHGGGIFGSNCSLLTID